MPASQPIRSVAIGRNVLTVGVPGGTLITPGAQLSADTETADAQGLSEALAREERRTIGELAEASVMTASEATKRVEQAEDLLSAALAGRVFDLGDLPTRAALVLEVLQHLDKHNRYEEWLRYARAINGLLMLLKRWADLLRLLRTLLRSGDEVHEAGRAWAQHELGTLHLAVDEQAAAERLLERARETRERLGDEAGLAATEQSLSVLCRRRSSAGRFERSRLVALAAIGVLLLFAGGVAGAVVDPFGSGGEQLSVLVDGRGRVTAAAAAIRCPDRCDAELDRGRRVTLTASARRGSTFSGWSGDCRGTRRCRLTMDGARTAIARFAPAAEARTMTVRKAGDGGGRVTSPSGIDCGGACRTSVEPGTEVRLDANPDAGSTFAGWSGGGCGQTGACRLTVRDDVTVTALFTAATIPPGEFVLTVTRAGEGSGLVTSRPEGIDCGEDCDESFAADSEIELFQQADEGSVFAGWSGAGCSGTGACSVPMTQAQAVTASFDPRPPRRFLLTTSTSGSGSVSPACAQGCLYEVDAVVTLTGTPTGGNNTVAWTGCTPDRIDDTRCVVTMSGRRRVTATFSFSEP